MRRAAILGALGVGLLLSQVFAEAYLPRPSPSAVLIGVALLLTAGLLITERA